MGVHRSATVSRLAGETPPGFRAVASAFPADYGTAEVRTGLVNHHQSGQ
jgi:hypothetical protein